MGENTDLEDFDDSVKSTLDSDDLLERIFRENSWKYFHIHADQRLKLFQFYVTISTAIFGGIVLSITSEKSETPSAILGVLMVFFSLLFWKLDLRARTLVKNAEEAIKVLDSRHNLPDMYGDPNPLMLFQRDDFIMQGRSKNSPPKSRRYSYSDCFEWVFCIVGGVGLIIAVWQVWESFTGC